MTSKELRKGLRPYLELFAALKDEDPEGHPRRTLNRIRHIVECWEVFEYRLQLGKERKRRATLLKEPRINGTQGTGTRGVGSRSARLARAW